MWAVIGVYQGVEDNEFFVRGAGDGLVERTGRRFATGDVLILGEATIHAVANPGSVLTGAIHVYGGDFVNQPRRQWGPGDDVERPFDLDGALSQFAAANVAADQATLQADRIKLDYTVIKAPIAGRVGVVRVTPGNLVRANDTGDGLVTITQLKPLRISFSLPERELDLVRAALARNGAAPVRAYASGATQASATGKLFFVDSAVDTLSGTVTAKAMFDNEGDQLWPGQYVRIEVDLGARPNVTTVPLVAVSPGQGGTFAFVVKADGTVERRKVEIADSRNEIAVIASGIRPGEKVVIEGQARLRDGSPVVEKPAPGAPAAAGTDRTAQAQ